MEICKITLNFSLELFQKTVKLVRISVSEHIIIFVKQRNERIVLENSDKFTASIVTWLHCRGSEHADETLLRLPL